MRGRQGYSQATLKRAKSLRRDMTDAERALWRLLRGGTATRVKFRRQQPIGPFIADFVCQSHRLIVEVDGGQHANSTDDEHRSRWLNDAGYRVLRFWNNDVLDDPEGVYSRLAAILATPHPPTAARRARPSPSRGEGNGVDDA